MTGGECQRCTYSSGVLVSRRMACLVKHQADGLWCVLAWSILR